jgi:thiamine biosynthesis lipoprotein
MTMRLSIFFIVLGVIVLPIAVGCNLNAPQAVSIAAGDRTVVLTEPRGKVPNADVVQRVGKVLTDRAAMLDPMNGSVLGKLNQSEVGEIVPSGDVTQTLEDTLSYTRNCKGAFDPTLQILWDVYDFASGGRYVSDAELADARRWIDYHMLEMDRGGVYRKGENTRMGLGPTLPGAIADWAVSELSSQGVMSGRLQVEQCLALWGTGEFTYDVKYPLKQDKDLTQLTVGHLKLKAGDHMAALDDIEGLFFAHGQSFQMILNPATGRPEETIREAVIVSNESCLQASVYAYAVMVMGLEKGMKFLDDTNGVAGLMMTEDHELHVSGKVGERFWR